MTGAHHQALEALAEAKQKLTKALVDEPQNVPGIIELADVVRRLERQAAAAERGCRR